MFVHFGDRNEPGNVEKMKNEQGEITHKKTGGLDRRNRLY